MNPVSSDRLADLNKRYDAHEPHEIIHALINEEFPGRIALVSSFGAESSAVWCEGSVRSLPSPHDGRSGLHHR